MFDHGLIGAIVGIPGAVRSVVDKAVLHVNAVQTWLSAARHLDGKVRELRFHLLCQQTRVTYWLAPARRLILLTVFRKTRSSETAEVQRAVRAQKLREASHDIAHDTFDRDGGSR